MSTPPTSIPLRRCYDSHVASGEITDSPEAKRAFTYGWLGTNEYQHDIRKLRNEAGDPWYILFFMIGTTLVVIPSLVAWTVGTDNIDVVGTAVVILSGVVLLGLGVWRYKRSCRRSAKAIETFHAKWGSVE